MVTVIEVIETVSPDVKLTVLKLMSAPDVPTVPSHTVATGVDPSFVVEIRQTAAVPVASALVSSLIEAAVATPEEAAPNAVAEKAQVARRVPKAEV